MKAKHTFLFIADFIALLCATSALESRIMTTGEYFISMVLILVAMFFVLRAGEKEVEE